MRSDRRPGLGGKCIRQGLEPWEDEQDFFTTSVGFITTSKLYSHSHFDRLKIV